MPLAGNLSTLSLADLFQTLNNIKGTGVLRLTAAAGSRDIVFQQGEIVGVGFLDSEKSDDLPRRLLLLGQQEPGTEVRRKKKSITALFNAFDQRKAAEPGEREEIIRQQAMEQLQNLFAWNDAEFSFEAIGFPDSCAAQMVARCQAQPLRLNTSMVLIEAARQQDEWAALRERIRKEATVSGLLPALSPKSPGGGVGVIEGEPSPRWHLYLDDAWQGPYDREDIGEMMRAGRVDANTWASGADGERVPLSRACPDLCHDPAGGMTQAIDAICSGFQQVVSGSAADPLATILDMRRAHFAIRRELAARREDPAALSGLVQSIGQAVGEIANLSQDQVTRVIRLARTVGQETTPAAQAKAADLMLRRLIEDAEAFLVDGSESGPLIDDDDAGSARPSGSDTIRREVAQTRAQDMAELRSLAGEIARHLRESVATDEAKQAATDLEKEAAEDDSTRIATATDAAIQALVEALCDREKIAAKERDLVRASAERLAGEQGESLAALERDLERERLRAAELRTRLEQAAEDARVLGEEVKSLREANAHEGGTTQFVRTVSDEQARAISEAEKRAEEKLRGELAGLRADRAQLHSQITALEDEIGQERQRHQLEVEAAKGLAPQGEPAAAPSADDEALREKLAALSAELASTRAAAVEKDRLLREAEERAAGAAGRDEAEARQDLVEAEARVARIQQERDRLAAEMESLKKDLAASPSETRSVIRLRRRLERSSLRIRHLKDQVREQRARADAAHGEADGWVQTLLTERQAMAAELGEVRDTLKTVRSHLNRAEEEGDDESRLTARVEVKKLTARVDRLFQDLQQKGAPVRTVQPGSDSAAAHAAATATFMPSAPQGQASGERAAVSATGALVRNTPMPGMPGTMQQGTIDLPTPVPLTASSRRQAVVVPMIPTAAVRKITAAHAASPAEAAAASAAAPAAPPRLSRRARYGLALGAGAAALFALSLVPGMFVVAREGVVNAEVQGVDAPVEGLLGDVVVAVGQTVRAGQPLAHLRNTRPDSSRADALRAESARSEVQLATLRSRLEMTRTATGAAPSASAAAEDDAVRGEISACETALSALRKRLADEEARLAVLAQGDVVAPGDGVVSRRRASLGKSLAKGARIFDLAKPSTIFIEAVVRDAEAAGISLGDRVRVRLLGDQRWLWGSVVRILAPGDRVAAGELADPASERREHRSRLVVALDSEDAPTVGQGVKMLVVGDEPGMVRRALATLYSSLSL